MNTMNVNQVLAQMRVMEAQAQSQVSPMQNGLESVSVNEASGVAKTDFSEVLANSINSVNDNLMTAGGMAKAFQQGESNITMAELMVNMEKASVSFQAMLNVRNKMLSAYQDIMNMPV